MVSTAMHPGTATGRRARRRALVVAVLAAQALGGLAWLGGCAADPKEKKASPPAPRYTALPARKDLPAFMKGTVYEATELQNKNPYPISGYGLVVGLAGTGNNNGSPMAVRNFMVDRMVKNGFGSRIEGTENLQPEPMLKDPRTALVEVYAYLPPGARKGQPLDVFVQPVTGTQTSSLAGGVLYRTDLQVSGVDPIYPRNSVNIYARAAGQIFVNPVHVKPDPKAPARLESLRHGVVMGGGQVLYDRPLWLRVRTPQLSIARAIEGRIDQRFNLDTTAKTQDEGIVHVYVPTSYKGDWEHFMGVATHLYINAAPGFGVNKSKELAAEAVKPDALLMDISYCWEGLGEEALGTVRTLYAHPTPAVAYAAARAGAMIGDAAAEEAMHDMAATTDHPFQLNAVKTIAKLPESVRTTRLLSKLLSSENALVRIEAYRVLAEREAPTVLSRPVRGRFVLDVVNTDGPPLVYASRSGMPRIAVFGRNLKLEQPIMFDAMNRQLTISNDPDGKGVMVFDRTPHAPVGGQSAKMSAELMEVIYRLGGGSEDGFAFGYADLVGILRALSDEKLIAARFMLEDMPVMVDEIESAPPIAEPNAPGPVSPEPSAPPAPEASRPGGQGSVVRTGVLPER